MTAKAKTAPAVHPGRGPQTAADVADALEREAVRRGWKVHRCGSGDWPGLLMAHPVTGLVHVLAASSMTGRHDVTPEAAEWLQALRSGGWSAEVVRPSDLDRWAARLAVESKLDNAEPPGTAGGIQPARRRRRRGRS